MPTIELYHSILQKWNTKFIEHMISYIGIPIGYKIKSMRIHLFSSQKRLQIFMVSNNPNVLMITSREKEILTLIVEEYTSKEIAQNLFLSQHTVISHRKNMMKKYHLKNTAGLVRLAFEIGVCKVGTMTNV